MIRRAILLAGAAALWPLAAGSIAARAEGEPGAHFEAPRQPLILTRTLWRSLHDGAQIMVRRRYALHFVASGDGYRIDGQQLDVMVEAPEEVAGLAVIERKRIDETMFPMQLDSRGQIAALSRRGAAVDPARQAGFDLSRGMVQRSALPAAARREAERQLAAIAGTDTNSAWPTDLFAPNGTDFADRREIALPDGGVGVVEVAVRHLPGGTDALSRKVERTITTRLGGTARVSREVWTLTAD